MLVRAARVRAVVAPVGRVGTAFSRARVVDSRCAIFPRLLRLVVRLELAPPAFHVLQRAFGAPLRGAHLSAKQLSRLQDGDGGSTATSVGVAARGGDRGGAVRPERGVCHASRDGLGRGMRLALSWSLSSFRTNLD